MADQGVNLEQFGQFVPAEHDDESVLKNGKPTILLGSQRLDPGRALLLSLIHI